MGAWDSRPDFTPFHRPTFQDSWTCTRTSQTAAQSSWQKGPCAFKHRGYSINSGCYHGRVLHPVETNFQPYTIIGNDSFHTPVQHTWQVGARAPSIAETPPTRSTFDRLRPIASRPPKFPKIQYGFGSIFEMARILPPQNTRFRQGKTPVTMTKFSRSVISYLARYTPV